MFIPESIKIYLLETHRMGIFVEKNSNKGCLFICNFKCCSSCAVKLSMPTDRLNEHINITMIYYIKMWL